MPNKPNFIASTYQGKVIVKRSDKDNLVISMSPAESDKATNIVGSALSMISINHPDHITNTPFVVRFFDNNVLALERSDQKGSLPFKANEGDELIKVIQTGLGMALNEQTLGRALPPNNSFVDYTLGDEPL